MRNVIGRYASRSEAFGDFARGTAIPCFHMESMQPQSRSCCARCGAGSSSWPSRSQAAGARRQHVSSASKCCCGNRAAQPEPQRVDTCAATAHHGVTSWTKTLLSLNEQRVGNDFGQNETQRPSPGHDCAAAAQYSWQSTHQNIRHSTMKVAVGSAHAYSDTSWDRHSTQIISDRLPTPARLEIYVGDHPVNFPTLIWNVAHSSTDQGFPITNMNHRNTRHLRSLNRTVFTWIFSA